ncbi:RNA-binding domain-containing protein [Provencibacterium massiliense]|uniref:RNA-binding domain-containing protein n=1 Tax=Provencibacterium massiliense TaxID=1841868 RepID=UPI00117A93BC|nr:RNA-binding domain-containing protein [Provencibacterium massiliense]
MNFKSVIISEKQIEKILNMAEDHFNDLKGKRISPSKLSECISSFANTSGGEIYLGIEEVDKDNNVRS